MAALFQKILIAIPEDDDNAVGLARVGMAVARAHDAKVRLISVVPIGVATTPSTIGIPGTDVLMPDAAKVTDAAVKARTSLLADILTAHSARDHADQKVIVGDPATEIIAEAGDWGAGLIIVGARDKDWISRLLEPSISQAVIRSANCAVLVFPEMNQTK